MESAPSTTVRLLSVDGDLGAHLSEEERAAALPHAVGELHVVPRGIHRPVGAAGALAALVLEGPMLVQRSVGGSTGVELLGDGDVLLLRPHRDDGFLEVVTTWQCFSDVRLVYLDTRFASAMRQWPGLGLAVLERAEKRMERIGALSAMSQLVRVDARVEMALWQLSESWGRVTSEGVLLPLPLTHRMLAGIVGARRPSVTTAIAELQRQQRVERRDEGWLLLGPPPHAPKAPQVLGPWHSANGDGAAPAREAG